MNLRPVQIRELAAWGLDLYDYRPEALAQATSIDAAKIPAQPPSHPASPLLETPPEALGRFTLQAERADLLEEMSGLSWSLGVVDLRPLIAFQRRLSINAAVAQRVIPGADDWPALFDFAFGAPKPIEHEAAHDASTHTVTLRSNDPNLHLRMTNDPAHPLRVHAGSPFLEVCRFRDRWFLRDGYHRAYSLLRAGIFAVPAVIVEATTIEELGANQPWFFPEKILFSDAPPRVIDFLDKDLILEYTRPPLLKTITITMGEALKPIT